MRLPLRKAQAELASKSEHEVERDVAVMWAARAVVRYRRYARTGRLKVLLQAERAADEAVEHAGVAGDMRKLAEIRKALEVERARIGKKRSE